MTNTNDVLSAITNAHAAYLRVPDLEKHIEVLQGDLDNADREIETKTSQILDLTTTVSELKAKQASLEAELEAATFRELLAEEKLEKITSLLQITPPEPVVVPATPMAESEAKPEPVVTDDSPKPIDTVTFLNLSPKPDDGYWPNCFKDEPYWNKPNSMTDERFAELGGKIHYDYPQRNW